MKLAIVGSRNLTVEDLGAYLPEGITEFVSGGARGVDACARIYAQAHGIPIKEFLPDYPHYGRGAPLRRNREIIAYADALLAFWDGQSHGTKHTIELCRQAEKPVTVILLA